MHELMEWFAAQWTTRFSEIALTMGDLQLKMQASPVDQPPQTGVLWWEQPFDCSPKSPIWIGAPEATWSQLGKLILTAAGVDSAPPSELQSTYLEIIRQSVGSLAQDIGDRIGIPVAAAGGSESAPSALERHTLEIETALPGVAGQFYLVIAKDLCAFVSSRNSKPVEALVVAPEPRVAVENTEDQALAMGSRTLELLMDVELPVSVSFGRASLKLQDAMKLITGSLIELDRGVTDPVELLVNNCVIARGEVVVIEGNYGVRIIEIVSQKERLQQTRRYILQ